MSMLRIISKALKLSNGASTNQFYTRSLCVYSESEAIQTVSSTETVYFLINSCGLSPEAATKVAKSLNLKTLENAKSIVTLLSKYGFTETQIATLVRKRSRLLTADPEKTIDPKLQFLKSIGASKNDIGKLVSRDPIILTRSLENQLIPNYEFIKSFLKSDEKVVGALRRTTWILFSEWSKIFGPNIEFLREFGVREESIRYLLVQHPQALMASTEKLKEVVYEIHELGLDKMNLTFVIAIHTMIWNGSKISRDRCYELYRKWGWSEDEILSAFKKQPIVMNMSEAKITRTMEFLGNEMGWPSSEIAKYPAVLLFSLEKRTMPRCFVIQGLIAKGILKIENVKLGSVLVPPEPLFLKRFVAKYEDQVPNLMDYYQGKLRVYQGKLKVSQM